ncbi:MAG: YigZ family protein [Eubacteriales bacterium]|nr:YigZ family protein [Eubacteriales bacterium]
MLLYYTVSGPGEGEQIINRSRFIAHVKPAECREEAEEFFSAVRKEYRDATHNVPAYVLGDKQELQWASDDGEPSGTSGAPIVRLLVMLGLTNTAVIITRYFGGIKLGTGGLVRAYSSSARLGLEKAGVSRTERMIVMRCAVDYSSFQRIRSRFPESDSRIVKIDYAENVRFSFCTDDEKHKGDIAELTNLTQGKIDFMSEEEQIVKRAEPDFFH